MADLTSGVDELLQSIDEENLAIQDIMKRLESVQFPDTLVLNLQAKLISRLANCQRFIPINCLDAEQRVNGLLDYLPSLNYKVCALACSLMKVFCSFLDNNGQHITTQVTISCKNLLTIITKTEKGKEHRWSLCRSIALASLCSIATDWSSKLEVPSQWLAFVLLSLNAVFGVLLDQNMHPFVHQVASEGLRRVLNIPQFWTTLTSTEQNRVILHLKQLFEIHFSTDQGDYVTLIKLLHSAANEGVVCSIVCTSKNVKDFLDVCWRCLPQINPTDLDMKMPLDVRWAALKLLWNLFKAVEKHQGQKSQGDWPSLNLEKFKNLFANGSCDMDATHMLKQEICNLLSRLE